MHMLSYGDKGHLNDCVCMHEERLAWVLGIVTDMCELSAYLVFTSTHFTLRASCVGLPYKGSS